MWFIRHSPFTIHHSPFVIRQAAAPATRRENAQAVLARFDRGVNGLCLEHRLGLDIWIRVTRK